MSLRNSVTEATAHLLHRRGQQNAVLRRVETHCGKRSVRAKPSLLLTRDVHVLLSDVDLARLLHQHSGGVAPQGKQRSKGAEHKTVEAVCHGRGLIRRLSIGHSWATPAAVALHWPASRQV